MRVLAVTWSSAATIGLLLAAELGLRAFGSRPGAPAAPGFARAHRHSDSLGWVPRADFAYTERGVSYTLNAAGHRGADYGPARRPGTMRVVLLGDSLAYGYGVGDEQTFAHLVDAARADLEVVNLGVQGYGLDQSLVMLEERGVAYRPDVVVLAVCAGNDFLDDLSSVFLYDGRHPKPYYAVVGERLVRHDAHLRRSGPARLARLLRERSVLVERLAGLGAGSAPAPDAAMLGRRLRLPGGELVTLQDALAVPAGRQRAFWHEVSDVSFRLIAEIGRVAAAHGGAYHVLFFPSDPSHFAPASWYEAQLVDARARPDLQDVSMVDMGAALARRGASAETFGRYYLDTHCHLTPTGHRLAAEELGALLRDVGRDSH
jgi:hypothetical protein